ncbi:MAG: hypothetical protein IKR85_05220 [Clostridia bacterium]|nr:hypothetical protein [Clostridia bacterium]
MFELYDFDANFTAYSEKWIEMNKGKFKTFEQMEEAMPEVYLRWLNSPAAFLGGETPGAFFQKYDSAPELVKWVRLYDDGGISVPDQLLDRITDLGADSVKPLLYTAKNEAYSSSLRMLAVNLLKELDAGDAARDTCLELIDRRMKDDELADVAAELLQMNAASCKEEILERLDSVSPEARETYLDILANYPGDSRVFEALMQAFETDPGNCALYASLLGKYGDERALPVLTDALDRPDINYLDYMELKNAIEMLGGECTHDREFAGDPYYETLKGE